MARAADAGLRERPGAHFVEPDWRRLPGFADTTAAEWESPRWQRTHSARDAGGLQRVFGSLIDDELVADIARDQAERATMPLFIPPQMLNTMDERHLREDPVRRYMAPAFSERDPIWPSHPLAVRDSLHEATMWAVEGLTHRYPAKVLVELVMTCPQYCGYCTRMDLVGPSTPQATKRRFGARYAERTAAMLDYLRAQPQVRDVVVSGGDVANVPIAWLEQFVSDLLDIETIHEVQLASKTLVAMPQHYLQPELLAAVERLATTARARGANIALHTHANHRVQITPLVARATRALLDAGLRDVRNQGVLLRAINDTAEDLVGLSERLLYDASIMPYYVFMGDIVPGVEHWRTSLAQAQELQQAIMGRLPGYATPRLSCDVPLLGKKWVHQVDGYDRERGISTWTKRYATAIEVPEDPGDAGYAYYDPIHALPEAGQRWWAEEAARLAEATA